jgi:hypothetical protein
MATHTEKHVISEDVIAIDAVGLGKYLDSHPASDELIEKLHKALHQVIEQDISDHGGASIVKPPHQWHVSRLLPSTRDVSHNKRIVNMMDNRALTLFPTVAKLTDKVESKAASEALPAITFANPQYLREHVLQSADWLTAKQVSQRSGSSNVNASALPNRWKKSGKVFAITIGKKDLFPSYIFSDDGKPLPIVSILLARFHDKKSVFKTALWFASSNSWLNGKAPKDMLNKDVQAVITAADKEMADNVFG